MIICLSDHNYGLRPTDDLLGGIPGLAVTAPSAPAASTASASASVCGVGPGPSGAADGGSGGTASGGKSGGTASGGKKRPADKLDTAIQSLEQSVQSLQNPDLLFGQFVGVELGRVVEPRKMAAQIEIMRVLSSFQDKQ